MHRERNRGVPVRPEAGLLGAQEPPEYRRIVCICVYFSGEKVNTCHLFFKSSKMVRNHCVQI